MSGPRTFVDTNILVYAYDATAAVRGGAEILLSEDLPHGRTLAGVRVINPFLPSR